MENKRGWFFFLKVTLIIIGILLVLAAGASFYLYKIYVFKTVRVCVSSTNVTDTKLNCTDTQFCTDKAKESGLYSFAQLKDAPAFLDAKLKEMIDSMFICETTCKVKAICSSEKQVGMPCANPSACSFGEKEIKIDLHGKELLEMLKFAKANGLLTA
jgi:hypothetical protein